MPATWDEQTLCEWKVLVEMTVLIVYCVPYTQYNQEHWYPHLPQVSLSYSDENNPHAILFLSEPHKSTKDKWPNFLLFGKGYNNRGCLRTVKQSDEPGWYRFYKCQELKFACGKWWPAWIDRCGNVTLEFAASINRLLTYILVYSGRKYLCLVWSVASEESLFIETKEHLPQLKILDSSWTVSLTIVLFSM